MSDRSTITIPAPQFELFEFIVLCWNDQEHHTKVTRRWLDLDDGCWWYQVQGLEQLFPEDALGPRLE